MFFKHRAQRKPFKLVQNSGNKCISVIWLYAKEPTLT